MKIKIIIITFFLLRGFVGYAQESSPKIREEKMPIRDSVVIWDGIIIQGTIVQDTIIRDTIIRDTIVQDTVVQDTAKNKKAWEFGLGGTVFQFSRVGFSNFVKDGDGYLYDLNLNHAVWGVDLYVARELTKHFYLDLQGNIGLTDKTIEGKKKWLFTGGVGLQWRLGEYFKSPYIDPYLRAGINYMHKDFVILYAGNEGLNPDEMQWVMNNYRNKDGADRKNLLPIALGAGVNMWLNDCFGIGTQADYLLMPYKNVANSLQGTVRLIWRIGGKSKKPEPEYIDRLVEVSVEKILERIVIVVDTINDCEETMAVLFDQLDFDFDSDKLTEESEFILDHIAEILKQHIDRKFLLTGQTDSRGSYQYNMDLSRRRVITVLKGLLDRGLPSDMLKGRGVGKQIAIAKPADSDRIRRGDRKITIELVTNMEYWNSIKSLDTF